MADVVGSVQTAPKPDAKESKGSILVVDDEVELLVSCRKILSRLGYEVQVKERGAEALEIVQNSDVDLVLTDLKMPGMTGTDLLAAIKKVRPDQLVVIFTAFATVQTAVEAIRGGAFDYLQKPFSAEQLEVVVARAIEHRKLREENRILKTRITTPGGIGGLIGESPAIQRVFELIRKIARTNASVLIGGESGTGKEGCARAIHQLSDRASKELVSVDCASLPGTLIESELFGYEKGAFTGANTTKKGLLEHADGGSIFLDEIGEMDIAMQVKLLRVLQERQFRRVGGNETITVDVRLIAATNRDLEKEVARGTFREDLFHRLNVIRIDMPPLRERTGDLRLLVNHFVRKFAPPVDSMGNPTREIRITPEVWAILESYHWPGNVRELQNVIHRAVSLCDDGEITSRDLPDAMAKPGFSDARRVEKNLPYKEAKMRWLEPFEREYLIELLKRNKNNVTYAASDAGIDRKSIQRMMKKHGIKVEEL
ncbi:MAG TPA: sigma-54 dependent transcriptional regulator [bacterium]|nr:sigma-54 dependent transcriptional regulator [bacterium]